MLDSDWLTNVLRCAIIFRETHSDRSSRQLSWPVLYHFAKWFLLFQRSYNRKITKTHNDTDQTNKYGNNKTVSKRIKSTDIVHVFATKLRFIVYGKQGTLIG